MNNKRCGKFYISMKYIERYPENMINTLFALKFIPLKVETLWHMGMVEYIGISEKFEEIEIGNITPEYHLTIEEDSKGNIISIKAIQV